MRRGRLGTGRFRPAANNPSRRVSRSFLELPLQRAESGVFHVLDDELVLAPRLVQPDRPRTSTFWPSCAVNAHSIFRCGTWRSALRACILQ